MRFEDFIEQKKARKSEPDIQLARSLIKMSETHMKSMKGLELNETTSSTIMAMSYEALREVIEAIAAMEGFKVYSHEAFTYFLRERGEDKASRNFDRFRKIRNSINYYGNQVQASVTRENVKEIEATIKELKNRHLSDM